MIVDTDVEYVRGLAEYLIREGYDCVIALDGDDALETLRKRECDLVICEIRSGEFTELQLFEQFKRIAPQLPVIVGALHSSISDAIAAVKRGVFQYLPKPYDLPVLLEHIAEATDGAHRIRKTTRPPAPSTGQLRGTLVYRSAVMQELVESIAFVARSTAPVLLLGESGSGKERVARAIHAGGARASQPFVAVNTAAIPEALLESEVFGHVKGAFTGASQARRGLLVEANGGSLLLDEIGDMPLMLQPKLLRVLQFGEARPVGSDRFGYVDVRIIAATHRDLGVLVDEGRFREDLRYRLNVIPLVVPPLRDRLEDIEPLANQFLEDAYERTPESPVRSISEGAMKVLREAPWRGNVRELENAIERLVVLGKNAEITTNDLAFLNENRVIRNLPIDEVALGTLRQMNQRYLEQVLRHTAGDKVRAAGILDIDLSTLYRWSKIKQ